MIVVFSFWYSTNPLQINIHIKTHLNDIMEGLRVFLMTKSQLQKKFYFMIHAR